MIRLTNIALRFDHQADALAEVILRRLNISERELLGFTVVRKAIDARRKARILAVYTIDVRVTDEGQLLSRFAGDASVLPAPDMNYRMPTARRTNGGWQRPLRPFCRADTRSTRL
jgi:uncharacterized FAD-dependent dehydrogenase